MKYFKLIVFLFVLSAVAINCKEDDDPSESSLIIGKWTLVEKTEVEITPQRNDTLYSLFLPGSFMSFENNGVASINFVESGGTSFSDTSSYVVEGKTLKISELGEDGIYEITKITKTEMELYFLDESGAPDFLYSTNIRLKK